MTTVLIITALLLDRLFGELSRFHPLVGFGMLATRMERYLYGNNRWRGAIAVSLLVIPPTLLIALIPHHSLLTASIDVVILYLALGGRSLAEHACRVRDAIHANDVIQARSEVRNIVSRDTTPMDPSDISKATIESVLENGNDAIFGALFWFVVAGAPGALVFRLINTLDAMWGYRNERYRYFGWVAARLDDVMNFVPARLTAISYALAGRLRTALHCWRQQGHRWKSPNAGPVMAAGAGSLGVTLGGDAWYNGRLEQRPLLGAGHAPDAGDIDRALRLVNLSLLIWLSALILGSAVIHVYV